MTKDERAELRRLEAAATPGTWTVKPICDKDGVAYPTHYETWIFVEPSVCGLWADRGTNLADAAFIAAVRNSIIPLLDALDAAEERVLKLEAHAFRMAKWILTNNQPTAEIVDLMSGSAGESYLRTIFDENASLRARIAELEFRCAPDADEVVGLTKANELLRKGMESQCELMDGLKQENRSLQARVKELENSIASEHHEVEQILAQAIGGYPWYKDDQKNFPGSTEADGVCVGEHVPASLAAEAANKIASLQARVKRLEEENAELRQRDRVISHQLERRADGMDPLTKALRNETYRLRDRVKRLEEALLGTSNLIQNGHCWCDTISGLYCVGQSQCNAARAALESTFQKEGTT